MRNKGFTLIELLAVIAILGSIGVIVTISFMHSLSETYKDQCYDFIEEIENAACVYASLTTSQCDRSLGTCEVEILELLDSGLLSTESDPCTGEDIDVNATVTIEWNSTTGEKTCDYQGDNPYED